jgi:hypothetical protein
MKKRIPTTKAVAARLVVEGTRYGWGVQFGVGFSEELAKFPAV